jgi:hypothetical protein
MVFRYATMAVRSVSKQRQYEALRAYFVEGR